MDILTSRQSAKLMDVSRLRPRDSRRSSAGLAPSNTKGASVISVVGLSLRPMEEGERRYFVIRGDGPFAVDISCFVDSPPPPGFRPCAECGSRVVQVNERIELVASGAFSRSRRGALLIRIVDREGAMEEIRIQVVGRDEGTATGGGLIVVEAQ